VPGDANDLARTAMNSAFPSLPKRYPTSVVIYYPDGVTQVANSSAARAVAAAAAAVAPTYISAGLLTADSGTSYFTYADAGLLSVAEDIYLSNSGASCLVLFTTTEGQVVSKRSSAFLKDLNAAVDNAISRYGTGGIKAHVSGFLQISKDSSEGILMDVAVTDCSASPISPLPASFHATDTRHHHPHSHRVPVLHAAWRRAAQLQAHRRRVHRPGGCIRLRIRPGLATHHQHERAQLHHQPGPLNTHLHEPGLLVRRLIAPLLMLPPRTRRSPTITTARSLFLLTHFKASLAKGVPYVAAVEGMLRSSGHIILVSGATLASCFLALGTQPLSIVRSPGIATTFAVIGCVLSNLTLTPSLLLIGERWFAVKPGDVPPLSRWPRLQTRVQAASDWVDAFTVAWWRRVAQVTRTHKYSITIGLLALLVAPFAPQLPHFLPLSTQTENVAPRGTISIQLNRYLENNYSPSAVTPAKLLGVAKPGLPAGGGALTPAFFASVGAAVNATLAVSSGYVKASEVTGLAWSGTSTANAAAVASAVASVARCPATSITACVAACPAQACALRMQTAATLSSDANAMILQLVVERTINDDAGVTWTTGVNNALAAVNAANSGATWYLYVDPGPATVRYVGEKFGQLVGITACVVVFIIGVSFRSVAMALRAVVTLCAMEVAVFGSATAIYCRGYLGEGGALETFKGDYGLFWLMPILAFSLMTGLGLGA
jgi:hypothetical protein